MTRFARWIISSAALLFVVTGLTFFLVSLAPGDAARAVLSNEGGAGYTQQQYEQARHELGLDQPLWSQYWHWLDHLMHGSLGTDMFSGQPVFGELQSRIVPTLSIVVGTVLLTAVLGVSLGIVSARSRGLSGRLVDGPHSSASRFPPSGSR